MNEWKSAAEGTSRWLMEEEGAYKMVGMQYNHLDTALRRGGVYLAGG